MLLFFLGLLSYITSSPFHGSLSHCIPAVHQNFSFFSGYSFQVPESFPGPRVQLLTLVKVFFRTLYLLIQYRPFGGSVCRFCGKSWKQTAPSASQQNPVVPVQLDQYVSLHLLLFHRLQISSVDLC